MTLEYIPKISLDEVYNLLPLDYRERTNPIDIYELDDTSNKELVRKRFFKLKVGESEKIHLTLGKDLKNVFNKTKLFYEECPEYSCKPLFANDGQTLNLFGQEFFEGTPIDEKYASKKINDDDVLQVTSKLQRKFSSLEAESSLEAFVEEFEQFKGTILKNDSLHLFDKDFLNNCVFPYLEDSLLPQSFSKRWSPGDLAARNILIDDNLNVRIIDCEFAHQTHFHDEDWIRLAVFSSGNFKEIHSVKERLEQVEPWYHLYHCLRQTWLNRTIWQNEDYQHLTGVDLHTILKLTEGFATNNKNVSLLIHGILDESRKSLNRISVEKDIRLQKENELATEIQLRLSKENELASEKELRLQKENELASEKELRLQKENELASEKELRLQKENELDAEKELKLQRENELLIKEDKILRMQNSFSWKITSPFRYIRRIKECFSKPKTSIQPKLRYSFSEPFKKQILPLKHVLSPFEFADNFTKHSNSNPTNFVSSPGIFHFIWLIPDFGIGSGGHTTIFRMIKWLENFGHTSTIMICGGTHHGNSDRAKEIISSHFFPLSASVDILFDPRLLKDESDIIISTSYDTCYYSRNIDSSAPRYYFVQDYEPQFASLGSFYYLAKNTYSFGFNCITAGKWLANKISSVGGNVSGYFELAVDKNIFFPAGSNAQNNKDMPIIAVYSRSATARRMTELAIFGLNLLSQRGYQFKVIFFGDSKIPVSACFEHQILGVVNPESLAKVYRSADIGCVFSGTNYSLVPLEMMASGLPIVEFDGPNTRETFPDGSVRFAKPDPVSIANEIQFLLANSENKNQQITEALHFIKDLSWKKSARKFEKIVKNEFLNQTCNHEG